MYSDTTIGFADATKEYDEEFFKEHNIVLVLLTASSGSIRYKVSNVNSDKIVKTWNSYIKKYGK